MDTYAIHYNAPIGRLYIAESDGFLVYVGFEPLVGALPKEAPLILHTAALLDDYFAGKLRNFELPIKLNGTDFQLKAWDALLSIPYGCTLTYKEQAKIVGNAQASRAVGAANGKNPISIIVPCHRVIGSNGSLIGYGGGLDKKQALLDLEKSVIDSK